MQPRETGEWPLLVGERARQLYVLKAEDIDYIESHGNYVRLHVGQLEYLRRDSVKQLTSLLAGTGFVRIERSLLVNVRAIRAARPLGRGSYTLLLGSGASVRSGAHYRDTMLQRLPVPPGVKVPEHESS
ncbi:MAG: LytTR family DNA-binding domain-containing protein [Steroidobacteraceae bacterium]|jgi:two-component system LytT family response regulator